MRDAASEASDHHAGGRARGMCEGRPVGFVGGVFDFVVGDGLSTVVDGRCPGQRD